MSRIKGMPTIDKKDIVGKRLGRLVVLSYVDKYYDETAGGERMRHTYLCKCDCGVVKEVQRGQLVSEIVHSCGCSRRKTKGRQ